jgi:hypothetical protein
MEPTSHRLRWLPHTHFENENHPKLKLWQLLNVGNSATGPHAVPSSPGFYEETELYIDGARLERMSPIQHALILDILTLANKMASGHMTTFFGTKT